MISLFTIVCSGSTRLALVKELKWVIIYGCRDLFYIALQKILVFVLLSIQNQSQGTGMALELIQTSGKQTLYLA